MVMTLEDRFRTVTELPVGYREVAFLRVTQGWRMVWLNIASIGLLVVAAIVFFGGLILYHRVLDGFLVVKGLPETLSNGVALVVVLALIPLHEWLHGLGMQYYGHKVRYGFKWTKGVLYATSDNGLFWREQFVGVALAPLIGISLICLVASLFVAAGVGFWLMMTATLNATGAIGDVWMVRVAYRYPAYALIRDEEDGMRVFCP